MSLDLLVNKTNISKGSMPSNQIIRFDLSMLAIAVSNSNLFIFVSCRRLFSYDNSWYQPQNNWNDKDKYRFSPYKVKLVRVFTFILPFIAIWQMGTINSTLNRIVFCHQIKFLSKLLLADVSFCVLFWFFDSDLWK